MVSITDKTPQYSPDEAEQEYIKRLERNPERGQVVIIRFTNKRSMPLEFQIEPTGALAPPLQPDEFYEVVTQNSSRDYVVDVHLQDDGVRVWVEGNDNGQVFDNGRSVAY